MRVSSTNGSGLTGCATPSSSPLGSTSTTAAAGFPSFGIGSSSFSHGRFPHPQTAYNPQRVTLTLNKGPSVIRQKPDCGGSGSTSNQFESAYQQTNSDFGSSPFGPHITSSTFGSTVFGRAAISDEHRGSRIAPYATTAEVDGASFEQPAGKLMSVSAITIYRDKNHEELRWEDYQLGDKGGSNSYNTPNFGSGGPCGASTVSAFGSSSMPGFESSSRPPFEASSTLAFRYGSTPFFGQPTSTFDVNAVGTNPFPYGTQSSHFGPQITASTFGSMGFGKLASSNQSGGSRIAAYAATAEVDGTNLEQPAGKLKSISAIPIYRTKSHEELRWEDYQLGDKGGSNPLCTPNFGSGGSYGASTVSAFGSSSMLAFGLSSTPAFRFGSTPSFGQPSNAFISSSVGTNPSSNGTQSSHFGPQTTESTFGSTGFLKPAFIDQHGGSRIAPYAATAEVDGPSCNQTAGSLQSISAIPIYRDKSHEELRWEDYQLGDKGGSSPASQSVGRIGFGASMTRSSLLGPSPAFSLSATNPFSSSTFSNPPKTPAFSASGFGPSLIPIFSSSPFNASYTKNPFWTVSSSSSSATPYVFEAVSTPTFETSTSPPLVGALSSSAFMTSSSISSHASAPGTTPTFTSGLSYSNTQSSPLFLSASLLGQTNVTLGQTASTLGQGAAPSLGQSNILGGTSTVLGQNIFISRPSLHPTSNEVGFGQKTPVQAAQTDGTSNTNFGQTSAGVTNVLGQGTSSLLSTTQDAVVVQSSSVVNPFGTLATKPQTSIARHGSTVIQYGISSMPVADKPVPARVSSLLTSCHLSKRQFRLQARKYHPKGDDQKVPFFNDVKEMPCVPKSQTLSIPRVNIRELIIGPTEQWPTKNEERVSLLKDASTFVHDNGNAGVSIVDKKQSSSFKPKDRSDGVRDVDSVQKRDAYNTPFPRHTATHDHSADVELLMPKLHHTDYYTEPTIQELAAKERAEPGYCCSVKDFLVGRCGYGYIKFSGETDVQGLDLESLVQFNNREVIVYMDESKKPPTGQGLNKAAEVTLLNIKCIDKRTGDQYMDGPRVNKYRDMLMKAAKNQGAEFVSYDPVRGEWKFRVQHFSKYLLCDEDECEVDFGTYTTSGC